MPPSGLAETLEAKFPKFTILYCDDVYHVDERFWFC